MTTEQIKDTYPPVVRAMRKMGICPIITDTQMLVALELDPVPVAHMLLNAGINVLEIADRTDSSLQIISRVAPALSKEGLIVGIGSVYERRQLDAVVNCGVDFAVSPHYIKLVALTCDSWHIAHIPGALTPREIHMAYKVSRGPVKFFPAQQHLDDLKEIRPALARMCPDMTIIASGIRAISEEGLRLVFHSGADVITLGSAFFRKEYIGNWKELGRHIQRLTDMVQRART